MPYVYILTCADGSLYTGSCRGDPLIRADQHNTGVLQEAYTAKRRPVQLCFAAEFDNIGEAVEMEYRIKRWSRAKKQALIDGEYHRLPELARKRNFRRADDA